MMWRITLLLLLAGAIETNGQPAQTSYDRNGIETIAYDDRPSETANDPHYLGKPLSYWLQSIRDRNDQMNIAFAAIRSLGPAAYPAVPELTRIVSEPFTPIEVGLDGYVTVTSKLHQIQLHSEAVDCLAAIGRSAVSSAPALTEWALTTRVILRSVRNHQELEAFVDLVGIDVLERMRVAGAIAQFTPDASLLVAGMLKSPDEEATKLGVAILSEHAIPIAALLLKSKSCTDQKLGLKMLFDMWPVVAKDHLLDLGEILSCEPSEDR